MAKKPKIDPQKRRRQIRIIYQLKVTLKNLRPPIWRRIQVADDTKLVTLHRILQTVMGWEEAHLHEFFIDEASYGDISQLDDGDTLDERKFRLKDLIVQEKKKFLYVYDFGDDWQHEIVVEKILPVDSTVEVPRCIGGKRACPPEDCGGPWGYEDLLESLADPSHPDHQESREWVGEDFDPAEFSVEVINAGLRGIRG